MIARVITGGQTGADQAGWRAARRHDIPAAGWMPRGYTTESPGGQGFESHPEFAEQFGAWEHESSMFAPRTKSNCGEADALVWFGRSKSPGGRLTIDTWTSIRAPAFWFMSLVPLEGMNPESLILGKQGTARMLQGCRHNFGRDITVMVAGNRESSYPGIGALAEDYLAHVFRMLGYREVD